MVDFYGFIGGAPESTHFLLLVFELFRAAGLDFTSELIRPPRHLQIWGVSCSDAPPRGPTLERELGRKEALNKL